MRRLFKGIFVIMCGLGVTVAGGVLGYYAAFNSEASKEYEDSAVAAEAKPAVTIGDETVLEFVYNYEDGYSQTRQSIPQSYMYGWTRDDIERAYGDWQMTEFSKDRVVFVKNVEGDSPQHYILKEKDGYVAVYYKESGVLKEMTSAPVASLSENERKLFEEGIEIDGEVNLIKYIEGLET